MRAEWKFTLIITQLIIIYITDRKYSNEPAISRHIGVEFLDEIVRSFTRSRPILGPLHLYKRSHIDVFLLDYYTIVTLIYCCNMYPPPPHSCLVSSRADSMLSLVREKKKKRRRDRVQKQSLSNHYSQLP